MRIGPFQVTYCTNVHPGESVDAALPLPDQDVAAVKTLVGPNSPFGTGLRLSNQAVQTLQDRPRSRSTVRDVLSEHSSTSSR